MFRSLRHRNFRLFLGGQLVSLVGTWMQIVAGSWLVYRLTDSALVLGFFVFALNFPALVVSPLAGVAADRYDRRSILMLVNVLAMLQAVALWVLVITGTVQVWHLLVLSILLGILNACELTVRQSLISQLIDDPQDLPNAIALNSSVFNGSRLIGPALAGVVVASFGEGICFFLNAVSFLPVIVSLSLMQLPVRTLDADEIGGLRVGLARAFQPGAIRTLLVLVGVLSMLNGAFQALAPVFARDVHAGGPQVLGLLLSCTGMGAFLGAAYLAWRRSVIGLGRVVAVAGMAAGVAFMGFSVADSLWLAAMAALLSGLCMIMSIGGMNVIIQTLVEEKMRGRVMSLYGTALVGVAPLGSLAAGAAAAHAGAGIALFWAGLIAAGAMLWFWFHLPRFRTQVRPVYARKGIVP